ncbi:MAG: AAA family ATPase [Blastocatellia bacterium]|nr:AAA family ATPase [Blastocatellia bacterium]
MKPFSLSPNPDCLFLTPALKSVIAKVTYTIDERQGLTCILGDVGMGKTTLLRWIAEQYAERSDVISALMPNPRFISDFAFLKGVCQEFDIKTRRSQFEQENELKGFLVDSYQAGKNVVLFIDEAQSLNGKMLEQIRAMLNFETGREKLIQIVFSGQMELRDRLKDPSKKALSSRIFAPSVLTPMSLEDTKALIGYRCEYARVPNPFQDDAVTLIYNHSGGVPREVIKACSIAYTLMVNEGGSVVDVELCQAALAESVM